MKQTNLNDKKYKPGLRKESKPMGDKVICGFCTFAEGYPGDKCNYCDATIVAWSGAPNSDGLIISDFAHNAISGWVDYQGGCYCEYRIADKGFDFCRKSPALKEKRTAGRAPELSAAYFLCEEHWNELTIDNGQSSLYGCRGGLFAKNEYDHLRIYEHVRLGEIYVFNHGPMSDYGSVWFASLKEHWDKDSCSASQAEASGDPTVALISLIAKHDR